MIEGDTVRILCSIFITTFQYETDINKQLRRKVTERLEIGERLATTELCLGLTFRKPLLRAE
jgi:hypothetical protein